MSNATSYLTMKRSRVRHFLDFYKRKGEDDSHQMRSREEIVFMIYDSVYIIIKCFNRIANMNNVLSAFKKITLNLVIRI